MSFNLINLILTNLSSKDIKLDKNNNTSKGFSNSFDNILFEILQNKLNSFTKETNGNVTFFNNSNKNLSFLSFSTLNLLEENLKKSLNKILNILNKDTLKLKDLKLLRKHVNNILKDLKIIAEKKDNISIEKLNKFIFDIFDKIKNILNFDLENNKIQDIKINQELIIKIKVLKKENLNQVLKKLHSKFIEKESVFPKNEKKEENELKNIISFFSLLSTSISEVINEVTQNSKVVSFLASKYFKDSKNTDNIFLSDKDLNEKVSKNLAEKDLKNLIKFEKINKDNIVQDQNKINYQKIFEGNKNENISENNLNIQTQKTKLKKKKNNNLISLLNSENSSARKKDPKNPNKNLFFYLKDSKNSNEFNFKNLDNNSQKLKEKNLATFSHFSKNLFSKLNKENHHKNENKSYIDNNLNLNSNLDKQNSIIKNYSSAQEIKVGKTSFIISEQKFPNLKVLNVYQNQENLLKVRYHLATGELALILKVENMPPLTLQLIRKEIESILDNHSIFKRKVRIKNEKKDKDTKDSEKNYSVISKRI